MKHGATHFRLIWVSTIAAILRDKGVLLLLLGAPLLYAFFYPWPYSRQAVVQIPVMVVDQDQSSLSRQITRLAGASPRLALVGVTANEAEAQDALWRGDIEGYALFPANLKRHVVRGEAAVVTVEGNGAYALLNKAVLYGFSEAIGTVSAGVEIKKLQASGQSAGQARASRQPVTTQLVALFNPTEGYGSYVVPAVAVLILQQTLLMGAAMLMGTLVEADQHRTSASGWLARILALSFFGWLSGLFYFGWMLVMQDYPRGANLWGGLVLLALYVPTISTMGLLLGAWCKDRERAIQVLLFSALPMVFLSGFSWPVEALPIALQWLRWLLPSTSGIQAALHLNQMGASLADVSTYLYALIGLGLSGGLILVASTPLRNE
jgi:ABC-2 type transport system permease protein